MRTGTSIGQMSSKRIDNISTAIIGILVKSSQIEEGYNHKLGLLGLDMGLSDVQVDWIVQRIVKPSPLSSTIINDRLPEKYKMHNQQVTRLVLRMGRKKVFPAPLSVERVQSRKEFFLSVPSLTRNQLFVV